MTDDRANVQRLRKKLRENLMKCADNPDVDPVHDTRTGTRRLQATLEDIVRQLPMVEASDPLRDAATATMKVLRKIRHEAGPVRDLDVHRKLLEKLTKRATGAGEEKPLLPEQPKLALSDPDELKAPNPAPPLTALDKQVDDLDAWLRHRRNELAAGIKAQAKDFAAKLDKRVDELEAALQTRRVRRARKKPPGVVALDSFARLASEMQVLDAGNLHDFRKGAKKARYVAELAAHTDAQARLVGETLKKLQDEIGDWHDWVVLAEEAHSALGHQAPELIALLEAEREQHFVAAIKMAAKLRGRLMGEWLAVSRRPAVRATNALRTGVARRRRATS
ncbi:MAG TPA: CHAD domain-containing protein [Acidobacteriaceae bacterium]|jgi:CHAD domain-containing protein|nr:CHAD domain-containing protein [Acidobacteriaceae bacterium]